MTRLAPSPVLLSSFMLSLLSLGIPAVALLSTAILSPTADAALVDSNDLSLPNLQSADGKNITTDTSTGLDWLDIDTTTHIGFLQMSALLGAGELSAFRYATLAEVDIFFNHLGIPTGPLPDNGGTWDVGSSIFSAASGHTGLTDLGDREATGFVVDLTLPLDVARIAAYENSYEFALFSHSYTVPVVSPDPHTGSWLVRAPDAVPEPASVVVWGLLGALGLACSRGRRRSRTSAGPSV